VDQDMVEIFIGSLDHRREPYDLGASADDGEEGEFLHNRDLNTDDTG